MYSTFKYLALELKPECFFTRNTSLITNAFTPETNAFYTKHILHQKSLSHLYHLLPMFFFEANAFYTKTLYIFHPQKNYRRGLLPDFYTTDLLHKKPFSPQAFDTKTLDAIHAAFIPETFYKPHDLITTFLSQVPHRKSSYIVLREIERSNT